MINTIKEVKKIKNFKDKVREFEEILLKYPQEKVECTHRFLDGLYSREVYMKAGTIVTSKTHKTENISIMSKGKVIEATDENNVRTLEAPMTMISVAGMKRVLYILEDTVWTTVHLNINNERDLKKLEDLIIEKKSSLKLNEKEVKNELT